MNPSRKILGVWAAVVLAAVGIGVMVFWFSKDDFVVEKREAEENNVAVSDAAVPRPLTEEPVVGATLKSSETRFAATDSTPTVIDSIAPSMTGIADSSVISVASRVSPKATLRAASGGDSAGLVRAPPSRSIVKIGGREIAPPNFSGHYQRVKLARKGKAEIRVEFMGDKVSEEILVRAIHGGKINGGENYAVFDLGRGKKEISFTFESGGEAGISEVILRRGTTEEVLQFWAPTDKPQYDPPALSVGS